MAIPFLNNITIDDAGHIQFKTSAGGFGGKINQNGNDLVLSNTSGDIIIGNGSDDVYIGDGTNAVDIRFEQNMAIYADSSSTRTLTLGGANTNLILESPTINGSFTMGSTTINNKLTFTTANGYILFDHEPSGDTGDYEGTTSVPLLKIDRGGTEKTILERVSQEGGILLGADDSVIIAAGDTRNTLRSNLNEGAENVILASETGFHAYGFPDNMSGGWSDRQEFRFYTGGTDSSLNGLWIGDGGNTQFIDLNRNLTVASVTSGGHIKAQEGGSVLVYDDDDDTKIHINAGSNATEGVLRVYNGANFGFVVRGKDNSPRIGAYHAGALNIYGFGNSSGADHADDDLLAQFDFANEKFLVNGEVEATTLDINGNADISGTLKVNSNYTANTDANDLQIGSTTTGNGGLSIITGNSQTGGIYFGDNDNNDAGRIKYIHSSNRLLFDTNRTNALILDSSQNATFAGTVTATYFYGDGSNLTNITATDSTKLPLAGGTMTGDLTIDRSGDNISNIHLRRDNNGDGEIVGDIDWLNTTAQGTDDRLVIIRTNTQGGTSGSRGGLLSLYTRAANSSGFNQTTFNQAGNWSFPGDIAVSGTVDGVDIAALATANTGDQDLSGLLLNTTDTFNGVLTINTDTAPGLIVKNNSNSGSDASIVIRGARNNPSAGVNPAKLVLQSYDSDAGSGANITGGEFYMEATSLTGGSLTDFEVGVRYRKDGSVIDGFNIHDGTFTVNGDIAASNFSGSSSGTNTGDQDLSSLAPKASPTFTGDITIPNKIIHTGDTNTYMQFEAADVWRVVTGGTERLDINTNRILVGDDMNMNFDGISGGNVDGNNVQQSGNSGTVVYGGFLNPASEANMVHIPHIINDLAGFNRWSNATITTSGFYKSRNGSSGSYTYSNEVTNTDGGWANAFDAHSSTAGSWYSDNGSDGIYQHGTDTPGVVELEWTNEATYSLWAGIVFGSGSFTATYVKIEAYRAGAWQTLCEITDNTDQVVLRQVSGNSGTNAATRRLRYTLGGSVNNSYFRIHSLYMVNYAAGNLNLNNTGTDTTRGINFLERYKDGYLHGHLRPGKDDTYDLGSSSYEWKDGYFDGTVYSDALNVSGNITVGGTVDGIDIATLASNNTGSNTGDQDLSGLAPIASPTFTGTPAAPTASAGTNTTQIATTAFVSTAVANLVDSAPSDLNTLNELAAALNDDNEFSTTVTTSLGNRVRVDTASQGLDTTQQSNARTNISAQVSGNYITGTGSLSAQDLTDIGNLSGTNTGDQDLSGLVTLTTGQNITGVKTFQTDETFFKADDGHHIRLQRNDTSIVANNELGRISFAGDDPTDGTYNIGAQIIAKAENSWSASDYETRLEFQTRDTGGAATTALTLKKNQEAEFATHVTAQGKLTIGNILNATGDPDKFLCVNGSGEVQFRTGAEVLSDIGATSGGVTGSGTANRVTFWSGSSAVTSDAELTYNATTNVLSSQSFQITNNRNYLGTDTSGNARTLITLNDDNEVQISHSALSANSDTVIYSGNKHIFKKGGATKFSLDATGNASFNHNLSVSGNTTLSGNVSLGQNASVDFEGVDELTLGSGTEIQIDGDPGAAGQSMLSTGSAVEWGYPKQQTIIVSNFDDASSTSDWINMPINYPFESTTATYYHFFNCPAAGTVKKITMMHVSGTMTIGYQGTTTQLRVVKNGSGQTASGNLLADNSANDGSKISYSPNTTFAAGDRLQFQFKRSNSTLYWKGVAASIVIEFNAV